MSIWETIKKYAVVIGGLGMGLLYLLLRIESGRRKDAEAVAINAEAEKVDAVLAERQSHTQEEIDKARHEAELEKNRKLTIEEMEELLKRL